MSYRSCSHLSTVTDIPIPVLVNSKERPICADCDFSGQNLWICLYRGCLKIGCSSNLKDHSTLHNTIQPRHCIHMNLSTQRIWCYECQSEVFMAPIPSVLYNDNSDQEDCLVESRDSGHGSYSTLQTNSPERTFRFDKNGGFNVCSMSGDTSDSGGSDAEDIDVIPEDKPTGLVGLQNIGNTCYMNAALQALSNTIPLTNFFLECPASVHLLSEDRKPGLSRQYQALMRDIWMKRNGGYVTPSGILYGIRNVHAMFRGYHQHDTQEFLRNFMDQLHEELKQACPPECAIINDVDNMSVDEPALSSSYDSSEGEYETCDSGVSERSSLSDDNERPTNAKRRLSRSTSPRRMRARFSSASGVLESTQPSTSTNTNKKSIKYRSIISDIFDGKLLSSVQCLTCDRVSSRVETFQDLSLPIPSRDHLVVLNNRTPTQVVKACTAESVLPIHDVGWITWILAWLRSWFYGPMVTLNDCLAAFFSTDELKGDNMYSCERCNKLRNGLKYSKVLQLPEVLCIHLKRFRHELMYSSKISAAVSFPLRGLDMRPYLHKDCVSQVTTYELFSVICHHGTAGGGHYTCFALNNNSHWYEFDDQCVTRVSAESVQTCEAYVLFYRKLIHSAQVIKNKAFEMSEVYETAQTQEDLAYLSKQWLSRFNTCAEPGPIDNSDFLCLHGSVNPKRSIAIGQLTTMVPKQVYEYLYKKFGGCPPVTTGQVCTICQALQRRIAREYEELQQLNAEFEAPTHLLSNSWYTQWKNFVEKRVNEPPGAVDNTKENVANGGTEEYIEINEDIWNFFYRIYGGGPELALKRESPVITETYEQNRNDVDRFVSLYCKGDPMSTNGETGGDVAEEVVPKVVEAMPNNHSNNSNLSVEVDDVAAVVVVEESSNKKSFVDVKSKHRRRRRRDLN